MNRRITLLTDFGTADGYVAAMKGVLASRCPGAALDDVGHDVAPGDARAAAWALRRYWSLYPPGTVHLVVVDPGVGTDRRALAMEADGRFLVLPDNGTATEVLAQAGSWRAVEIRDVEAPVPGRSDTFHGRDVFAPAAAHLAAGGGLDGLGPEAPDPILLPLPPPSREGERALGEVVHVDRFGNLVTNVPGEWVGPDARVEIAGRAVGFRTSYGHVAEGDALSLVNSDGRVEVAVRDGSAAEQLGVGLGEPVVVDL